MNLGSDVIVLSVDEARDLLKALHMDWSREHMERLQRLGVFDAVDALRDVIRKYDADIYRQ